jgi:hypothetical protein
MSDYDLPARTRYLLARLLAGDNSCQDEFTARVERLLFMGKSWPDLLEACRVAARIFGGHSGAPDDQKTGIEIEQGFYALDMLRAAIALATNQPEKP